MSMLCNKKKLTLRMHELVVGTNDDHHVGHANASHMNTPSMCNSRRCGSQCPICV